MGNGVHCIDSMFHTLCMIGTMVLNKIQKFGILYDFVVIMHK